MVNEVAKKVALIAVILFVLMNKSFEAIESVKLLLIENLLLVLVIIIVLLVWRARK